MPSFLNKNQQSAESLAVLDESFLTKPTPYLYGWRVESSQTTVLQVANVGLYLHIQFLLFFTGG
jgi:hypothetical protein